MTKPKICLVMLVKDEERVIGRCLRALRPHIDCWVIVDTGSTDKTVERINEVFAPKDKKDEWISGSIYHREFTGFSHNRTEVMALAREEFPDADYLLMMDADDTWEAGKDFKWPELTHGAYNVKHVMGGSTWYRPALTKASLPWEYRGAAHEYMVCEAPHTTGKLKGPWVQCGNDGARRVNEGTAKYKRIAGILEGELETDPDNRRATFYLAQSYRDGGEPEKAISLYKKRGAMGGWPEEAWNALYQVGVLSEKLKRPWEESRDAYLRAYEYRPTRAEALCALASLHRRNNQLAMAHVYAAAATMTKMPEDDMLFVEEGVYSWRALDEYCIASNKLGMLDEAKWAALRLLANPAIDGKNRMRVEENLTFSCHPITRRRVDPRATVAVVLATLSPEPEALRAAVQSIIDQSHQQWRLYIVSDGNETPPWDALEGIEDDRISMHHLPKNCGQFPIYDAILNETDAPLFAVQDDDDISKPDRLQKLLKNMLRTNADVVFSDIEIQAENGKVYYWPSHPEWMGQQPNQIVHAGSHVGLWKTASLRAIGGYYGGFDLGADTVAVGLMARLGRPAFLREGLYRAKRSPESMTSKDDTGVKSPARKKAWSAIYKMWADVNGSEDKLKRAHELLSAGAVKADIVTLQGLKKTG